MAALQSPDQRPEARLEALRGFLIDLEGVLYVGSRAIPGAALKYATGREARVIGKPSPHFFAHALTALGLPAAQVAIVGDDLHANIQGGQTLSLTTILVLSGKTRSGTAGLAEASPDWILDSIADLPDLLRGWTP